MLAQNGQVQKKLFTLLDLCVSSLRRGHANLLCIVPILTDDPRRESKEVCHHRCQARSLIGSLYRAGSPQQALAHHAGLAPTRDTRKCSAVVHTRRTEVIASRSELLSQHCPRHPLLLALLPACAGSQVIMRQDYSAYAEEPLRTVGLLEAAHQYSL